MVAILLAGLIIGIICKMSGRSGGIVSPWQEHLVYVVRRATGASHDKAMDALVWNDWSPERAISYLRRNPR